MDRFKLAGILVLVHICRVSVEGVDEMNASNNRIREESYVEEIDAMIREAKMARSLLHVVETGDGAMDRDLRKKKEKKTGHYNDRNIKDDQVKRLKGGNINGRVGGNHNSKPKGGNGKDNGDQNNDRKNNRSKSERTGISSSKKMKKRGKGKDVESIERFFDPTYDVAADDATLTGRKRDYEDSATELDFGGGYQEYLSAVVGQGAKARAVPDDDYYTQYSYPYSGSEGKGGQLWGKGKGYGHGKGTVKGFVMGKGRGRGKGKGYGKGYGKG
mgnify:FL=1